MTVSDKGPWACRVSMAVLWSVLVVMTAAASRAGDASSLTPLLAPPANDTCAGAIVIPDGPYPVLSAVTSGVDQATGTGDPLNSCSPAPVENGVWYKWTPAVGGQYTISTCAGTTSTSDADGVLAVFTSGGGCAGSFTQIAGACNDDGCHALGPGLVSGVPFSGGTTYYILVSHYPTANGGGALITQAQIQINPVGTPPNDTCLNAETIPTNGPFPYLSSVVDSAGTTLDLELPGMSCSSPSFAVKGIWYRFVPPVTGDYLLSTCSSDHGGTATTATNTSMAVYTSPSDCVGPFTELPTTGAYDGCDVASCGIQAAQSFLSTRLEGGSPYYVVVSASTVGTVQLRVARPPVNDVCANATPVYLDVVATGTTAAAADDYRSPATALCYGGVGQQPVAGVGRDSVHTFTAPTTGVYSFRMSTLGNTLQALYIGDCYGGPPPVTVSCISGARRNSEIQEAMCVSLRANQQVYIYSDATNSPGGIATSIWVTRCERETEPNDTPSTASPLSCGMVASISTASDVDFFSLGAPPAGSRAFVRVDDPGGVPIRITDSTNTLQYSNPISLPTLKWVAGTPLTGGNAYVRVNTTGNPFEPYHLYYAIQPPLASATPETEPNDSLITAETTTTGYVSGSMSALADVDCFRFQACKGDSVQLFLDEDPLRNATPILGNLGLYDAGFNSISFVSNPSSITNTTPGAGLTATTPFSQSENTLYKATYSGPYYVVVSLTNTPGDYLLSITTDCQTPGTLSSDVSLAVSDAPDPVSPNGTINYTLTLTNAGPTIARDVSVTTATPANTTFQAVSAPPGWACVKPVVGGTGTVTCSGPLLEQGSQPVTLSVKVNNGTANGTVITLNASIANCHNDPNMGNNAATTTTTVTSPGAALPSGGADCFDSSMSVRVDLLPSFHPGGCTETLSVTGPAKIWRGDPVDPGDGLDVVPAVMGCYALSGSSSGGGCGLGTLLVHPSGTEGSLGQVKSSTDTVTYPADALFDLVVSMETTAGTLHAREGARVETMLNSIPPPSASTFAGNGITHDLYDDQGNVVGTIEVLQQSLNSPIACPCACGPSVALSEDKQTVSMGALTAGPGVQYDLARGTVTALAPDWAASFAAAACAQTNGGPVKLDALTPTANQLVWYLARDGGFGANGTYNQCPGGAQVGDHDGVLANTCP